MVVFVVTIFLYNPLRFIDLSVYNQTLHQWIPKFCRIKGLDNEIDVIFEQEYVLWNAVSVPLPR